MSCGRLASGSSLPRPPTASRYPREARHRRRRPRRVGARLGSQKAGEVSAWRRQLQHLLAGARVTRGQERTQEVCFECLQEPRPELCLGMQGGAIKPCNTMNCLAILGYIATPWARSGEEQAISPAQARVPLENPLPARPAALRYRRADVVLSTWLHARRAEPGVRAADVLDADIRSAKSRALAEQRSSEPSRRWGVISELQPEDFARAIKAANETA